MDIREIIQTTIKKTNPNINKEELIELREEIYYEYCKKNNWSYMRYSL